MDVVSGSLKPAFGQDSTDTMVHAGWRRCNRHLCLLTSLVVEDVVVVKRRRGHGRQNIIRFLNDARRAFLL
jgi:hypothetical protein